MENGAQIAWRMHYAIVNNFLHPYIFFMRYSFINDGNEGGSDENEYDYFKKHSVNDFSPAVFRILLGNFQPDTG